MRNKILTIIVIIIIIVIGGIYFYQNYKQKDINKYSFKNPVIPDGFFAVDTEQAKWERNKDGTVKDWNRGLVIEDSIGNQFIWIPVDLENINYDDIPVKIDSEYTYNIKEFLAFFILILSFLHLYITNPKYMYKQIAKQNPNILLKFPIY